MGKFELNTVLKYVGYLLFILSLYYVFVQLSGYDYSKILNAQTDLVALTFNGLLISLLLSTTVFFASLTWKIILESLSSKKITYTDLLKIYINTNMAKYLPGNVLHYVGRNIIGKRLGWTNKELAISTFLEVFLAVGNSFSILAVCYLFGYYSPKIDFTLNPRVGWVLGFGGLAGAVIFFFILSSKSNPLTEKLMNFFDFLKNASLKRLFYVFCLILSISSVNFIITGAAFYLTDFLILGNALKISDFINLTCSIVISGFAGIFTPGVPGGIGVKESVSQILISQFGYEKQYIMLTLIVFRIFGTIADVIAFLVSLFIKIKED